jgi:hypothetical protein
MSYPDYQGRSNNFRWSELARYANHGQSNIHLLTCKNDLNNISANTNIAISSLRTYDKTNNINVRKNSVSVRAIKSGPISFNNIRVVVWEEKDTPKANPPQDTNKNARLMIYEDIVEGPDTTRVGYPLTAGAGYSTINTNDTYGVPQGAAITQFFYSHFVANGASGGDNPTGPVTSQYRVDIVFYIKVFSTGGFSENKTETIFAGLGLGPYNTGVSYGPFGAIDPGFIIDGNVNYIKDSTLKIYNLENIYRGTNTSSGTPFGSTNTANFVVDFEFGSSMYYV